MALVSQSVSSYKGGVSQQPDIIRFPDQLKEQINGFSSEVEGLQKRPPTIHLKRLGDSLGSTKVKYHIINRDKTEQYILEATPGQLRVWDLQGNAKTVQIEADQDYLNVSDPQTQLSFTTVADYTFVLNKTRVTAMGGARSASQSNYYLLVIKNSNYGKTFEVKINGTVVCAYMTPNGQEGWHAQMTQTAFIQDILYRLLSSTDNPNVSRTDYFTDYNAFQNSSGAYPRIYHNTGWSRSGYSFSKVGSSVISIRRGGSSINIETQDGAGDTYMYVINGEVAEETKLPNQAPDGYICRVKGYNNSETSDDFYLRYNASKNTWSETVAPNSLYQINSQTMPHALVRESDGTFRFRRLTWTDRTAGDDNTNPKPSFIGLTINDIFFYRNRLGFISDENIILSRSADFFNFWFESAATIADTDPIDISVSSNKVSILTNAVPLNRELVVFSREGQFILTSDGAMTPKTAKVDQVTSFQYNPNIQPINIGQSIFFINDRIDYCSLMRFYPVQDVSDILDAEDTSRHIPRYIPTGIFRISGNTTENTITCISNSVSNTIWIYKFILMNGQTLQQSWSKWTMGTSDTRVLLAEFVNANIYYVLSTPSGLYLERSELTGNTKDFEDEPVRLFMDRKVSYTIPASNKYSDFNNYTEVSLSNVYGARPIEGSTYFLVTPEGYLYQTDSWDANGVFRVNGDLRNQKVFVGRQYKFEAQLSRVNIKQTSSQGVVTSEDEGRLMLRYYWFNYADSGVFNTRVENGLKHSDYTYTCTSKNLGVSDLLLGVNKVFSNTFRFPVHELNNEVSISVYSDNVLPLNLISGGWEGMYTRRTRKV